MNLCSPNVWLDDLSERIFSGPRARVVLFSQEATARTTALRDALGQLHGQLEDLREDHKQLQVL